MVCFLKKGNTIDLMSVGTHKSCYSELQGGGVLFKPEKADISWKNCTELTEEGVTMSCADKSVMRENYLTILLAGAFFVSFNAVFLGKVQAHNVQPQPITCKKINSIQDKRKEGVLGWGGEANKGDRSVSLVHTNTVKAVREHNCL